MAFFATPETMEELEKHLDQLSGGEKAAAALMMGLTWNYLANQVNTHNGLNQQPTKQDHHKPNDED